MEIMGFLFRQISLEKKLIFSASFLSIIFFVLAMQYENLFYFSHELSANEPVVGDLSMRENDTRYKSSVSYSWEDARLEQKIHHGDSIFTGHSSMALVRLSSGSDVVMGENSLVVFNQGLNKNMMNLAEGNFRVSIQGEVKIAIQGQVTTLRSRTKSEIQILAHKNKPLKLKLIHGEATVKIQQQQFTLNTKTFQTFSPVKSLTSEESVAEILAQPVLKTDTVQQVSQETNLIPLVSPQVEAEDLNFELDYIGSKAVAAQGFRLVRVPEFHIQKSEGALQQLVELSEYENFDNASTSSFQEGLWSWREPKAGLFYARVLALRGEERVFSKKITIRVVVAPPKAEIGRIRIEKNKFVELRMPLKSHPLSKEIEVQFSREADFQKFESVKTSTDLFRYQFDLEPGAIYIRARSLNDQAWPISRFSLVKKIKIPKWKEAQPLVVPPLLAKLEKKADIKTKTRQKRSLASLEEQNQLSLKYENKDEKNQDPRFQVWLGIAAYQQNFSQTGEGLESASFGKFTAPAWAVGARFNINDQSSLAFEYQKLPGEVVAGASSQLDTKNYLWKSILGEYQHVFAEKGKIKYRGLAGLQVHQLPFINANEDGTTSLFENEMNNFSLGAAVNYRVDVNTQYEFLMRYQSILQSKSLADGNFQATPNLIFDGSLGFNHRLQGGTFLGVYWFGQFQSIKYNFEKTGGDSSGTLTFFNSSLQLRIGYDFFGMSIAPALRRRRRCRDSKKSLDDQADANEDIQK